MAHTLIWVRTTDVIEEIHNSRSVSFHRFHEDVVAYNETADAVMMKHGASLLDLYSFTRTFGTAAYCDHVHFVEGVRKLQAAYIAGYMERYS